MSTIVMLHQDIAKWVSCLKDPKEVLTACQSSPQYAFIKLQEELFQTQSCPNPCQKKKHFEQDQYGILQPDRRFHNTG